MRIKHFLAGSIFAAVLILVPAFSVSAYSDNFFSHLDFTENENAYTQITDIDGIDHIYQGVLDTGWADKYNLGDCEDMMDKFAQNFYNEGYYPRMAIGWLLNGAFCWNQKDYV